MKAKLTQYAEPEHVEDLEMSLIEKLPRPFNPNDGDPIPPQLIGATIVRVGTLPVAQRVEGGGLVIEYTPPKSNHQRRVVFEFNELGMWVESDVLIST